MQYTTILTSKGTTTIPAEIRRQLGVKPGMRISFYRDAVTGDFILKRSQTIEELRALNQKALEAAGTSNKTYKSGDGFTQFVQSKYGSKK